jgi:uncharacterized protein YegP (UPF0339 family)
MSEGSSTRLYKSPNAAGGQWYWNTISGSDIVADSSEGYHNLADAKNGYLASQGVSIEDRELARNATQLVKIKPDEYAIVFDRECFETLKKERG